MKEILPISNLGAVVKIPGSKSITHRALIAAALADGDSILKSFLSSEDTIFTLNALREMGIEITIEGEAVSVSGTGGVFAGSGEKKEIYLGNSGTSYRLLLSIAALAKREFVFTGTPRMYERPIGELVSALNRLGTAITYVDRDGYPPVHIKTSGIKGGKVSVAGNISSQYISSLLLAGPYSLEGIEVVVEGDLVSKPYVDLTLDVMKAFGIEFPYDGYERFMVTAGKKYKPRIFTIEGDVSSASYFWAAAAITGGTVITENIYPLTTVQGDIAILEILDQMGCSVGEAEDSVMVKGGDLKGVEVDMGSMPDMVPTLAAVALFAEGKTVIRNVRHLHYKESDRIADTAQELRRIGAKIEELEDGLVIHGGQKLEGAEIDPHKDHRLAMSLAVAGLKVPGVKITDEKCVDKSFPAFWQLWDSLQPVDC